MKLLNPHTQMSFVGLENVDVPSLRNNLIIMLWSTLRKIFGSLIDFSKVCLRF